MEVSPAIVIRLGKDMLQLSTSCYTVHRSVTAIELDIRYEDLLSTSVHLKNAWGSSIREYRITGNGVVVDIGGYVNNLCLCFYCGYRLYIYRHD